MAQDLHVVFGAGQIGSPLASLLHAHGHSVRLVRRAGPGPDGIETIHGDAGDATFATEATSGASAIYHCMNPPYFAKDWAHSLPRFAGALLAAAGRAKARLVVLDNVYMLGRPNGRPLDEDSPIAPCSRKGGIRARVNEQLMSAHTRGDARVVVGRASDFYGPGGTATYFGDAFWPKALASGVAQTIVRLDTPHTYHYTLDVVAGLAALGEGADDVTGRWWMLPAAPAVSSGEMIARIGRALGRELKVQALPPWLLRSMGVFVPMLRELSEMAYQWEAPFTMNDSRFRARFGLAPTSLEAGVPALVEWAKRHYASKG